MSKIIHKAWPHISILGFAILFFIFAPSIYTHIFVNEGKAVEMVLPPETSQVRFSIDHFDVYDEAEGIYMLSGWSFLTVNKKILPEDYERQVVLTSEHSNLVFEVESVYRPDVQNYFASLGMHLEMAGYSSLIAKDAIDTGMYQVGFIFKHDPSGSMFFVRTGRCITRTPNQFYLEEANSSACTSMTKKLKGMPIEFNADLPIETSEGKYNVEKLDLTNGIYRLSGWSFPTVDLTAAAGDYERQIVLISETGNYVFAASTHTRADVEKYFTDNPMDLNISGFAALISGDSLQPGTYGIGFIFRHTASGTSYYLKTNRCLTQNTDGLILEEPGSTACSATVALPIPQPSTPSVGGPAGSNVALPVETQEGKYNIEKLKTYNIQGVYQLLGWSFPMVDLTAAAGDYERRIVLLSGTGNYIFAASTRSRADVEEYFSDNPMDLTISGFAALISQDALQPGTYGIGLIFKHTASGAEYYLGTNRCLTRNTDGLILEEPRSPACDFPNNNPVPAHVPGVGWPVKSNMNLPATAEGKYNVEKLELYNPSGMYRLLGWSFPMVDLTAASGDYERQIVLLFDSGNYIFAATTHSRADVERYFSDNPMDLTVSGFAALISQDVLQPRTYGIGLIFKRITDQTEYYIKTNRCLTRTTDGLVLEEPGSPACSLP